MDENRFDRDGMARWYADKHVQFDPGTKEVYYLPKGSPEREIRLLEVNDLMSWENDTRQPYDLAADVGGPGAHKLMVVDITPSQWEGIQRKEIPLPNEWTLDDAVAIRRRDHE